MELNVLFVEDNADERRQITRDLKAHFKLKGIQVTIDEKENFESGFEAITNPNVRYDLVITDTYRGEHKNRDAAVLETVAKYREGKFAPVIVCSSGECPAVLKTSAFVSWVDKASNKGIENAVDEILKIGIPQLARNLHDELDKAAGNYLWKFLEDEWEQLKEKTDNAQLERIIRRRAALAISDLMPGSDKYVLVPYRYGLEYYIYPSLEQAYYNLGDIIKSKANDKDIRVILTPHCHLFIQSGKDKPNADYVLTAKTIPVAEVLGKKLENAKELEVDKQDKKLKSWANSPAQTERTPEGRHWYLPKFLKIPHLFVDFLQIESIEIGILARDFERIATLAPPYSEALQTCFSGFYASVGIPVIAPESIRDLLD